jgi:hypothetical protein
MALARVVSFDGVTKDRVKEMEREMSDGAPPPEDLPAKEIVVLHDPEGEKSPRDPVLRERGRLPARRRDAQRHVDRRHARTAHIGGEIRRRDPDDRLRRGRPPSESGPMVPDIEEVVLDGSYEVLEEITP